MSDFDAIALDLEHRFRDGVAAAWTDDEFERRALAAFHHQFAACDTYRAFCARRGATPERVAGWQEIPAVPATAFKHFDFLSAPARSPEATFITSGTTRGDAVRGRHHVPRLELYRAALAAPFAAALLPEAGGLAEEAAALPFVSLIPAPSHAPHSSLSFMVGAAAERFASRIDWLVDADGRWVGDPVRVIAEARDRGEPVLMLGTALALVHLLEASGALRLPPGSRVMETGGFKGAGRSITREALHTRIAAATDVARDHIVNEYGMTELLSQLYEPVLTEGLGVAGWHVAPPWLRVRALDPVTLRPVHDGDDGILAFFDLANLGSICHVLTEDVGSIRDGRVRLRGRTPGAEPRGCSRAMDDLMAAAAAASRS